MNTRNLTLAALLAAIGTLTAHLVYIPAGVAKCFPIQHAINVLAAVWLGPAQAVGIAFVISLLRNLLGLGSLLAFPGSLVGAFLAGYVFRRTQRPLAAVAGEVFGTGILGGLLAFPMAKLLMGKETGAFFFIIPFLVSSLGGALIAYGLLKSGVLASLAKRPADKTRQTS